MKEIREEKEKKRLENQKIENRKNNGKTWEKKKKKIKEIKKENEPASGRGTALFYFDVKIYFGSSCN